MTKVSIEYQRRALLKLCRDKGWDDPIEYMDRNVSATNGKTRPAYTELYEDIGNGIIGKLAVWDLDRLHRQPRELEDFIDLAEKCGVELANVSGDVDLSTPSGRLFARMKGNVAKYECEQKSARQKAANAERANNGKAWNVRVFGYNGNEIIPVEADAIRQACRDLIDGASLWGIAKAWNANEIRPVSGALWTGTSVRQVLSRPRNAGLQTRGVHQANRDNLGKSLKDKVQGSIIEGVQTAWPAIVSRDTFDAVLAVLSDPKRHTGKRRALAYLLSGLAVCGVCGKKMGSGGRTTKKGEKRAVYCCKNTGCMKVVRDLAKTDALVVDIITAMLASPDAAAVFATKTVDTVALSAQAQNLRALITAAETDYDNGDIDAKRMRARIAALTPKLDHVERQLLGANQSRRLDGLTGNPRARAVFDALSLDRQRAVIDTCAVVTIMPTVRKGGVWAPELIRVDRRED
jgi:DNA invertase Pin-like site-specific DNA recombinase